MSTRRMSDNIRSQEKDLSSQLEPYYKQVNSIILAKQHPVTGLLPASTSVTVHGNYTDAWVRDNVYSILAVWALALAYRKLDNDNGRGYELEYATVKLMRGLLNAMMRQASKVERFKETLQPLDALHAKYDAATGNTVVGDGDWGHLQLDATSLYLLMLAQMTASGLRIIFTVDEVNFVQNLVYYISSTYRTSDYGIWERGNKINKGQPEINVSSVAMSKAALEALSGFNLFGVRGSQASVIHVLPDDIAKARITLAGLLPRESSSKEVDAALLSAISFPAFAVEDKALIKQTRTKIIEKLAGNYGLKRFLRDGHQTAIENVSRLYYEPSELKQFENIECEWPLFFSYLYLDALFHNESENVQNYREKLDQLTIEKDGFKLLPELYYVPLENIEAEKQNPHSQTRNPNDNLPLIWAQSLYLLGKMLDEGFLQPRDIDPLERYLNQKRPQPVVQIALLAEDEALQAELSEQGITTQTPKQLGIPVYHAGELVCIYNKIGLNEKLGLTGRPLKLVRSLSTSRLYQLRGELVLFLPNFFDQNEFYLTLDSQILLEHLKGEIAYLQRNWQQSGRPLLTLLLTRTLLETSREAILVLMSEFRKGFCEDVPVRLGSLQVLQHSSSLERIDNLHDFQFLDTPVKHVPVTSNYLQEGEVRPLSCDEEVAIELEDNVANLLAKLKPSDNLCEQTEILANLVRLKGLDFYTQVAGATVRKLLEETYYKARRLQFWTEIRRTAGLLQKTDVDILEAVADILVQQKHILIGKSFSEDSLITRPLPYSELINKLYTFSREDVRDKVLTQEILVYVSMLIKAEPELFEDMLTIRIGYLILLLTDGLAKSLKLSQDEAYEQLMHLAPSEIQMRLHEVMLGYETMSRKLREQEVLSTSSTNVIWDIEYKDLLPASLENWLRRRQYEGTLNRVGKDFYPKVWNLLEHCDGIIIGNRLDRRNRLDSQLILSEMTAGEQNFALRIERLLNKIEASEYRQLTIEALQALANLSERNPDLHIDGAIAVDVVIGHAVNLAYLYFYPERESTYDQYKAKAWEQFYKFPDTVTSSYIVKAFRHLIEIGQEQVTMEVDQEQAA